MIDAAANGITEAQAAHVDWVMTRVPPFEIAVVQLNCGCVITKKDGSANIDTATDVPEWVNNPAVGDVGRAEQWMDDHGF